MADNNLQFNIGGDASDFVKAINKVRNALGEVKSKTKQVSEATAEFGGKIFELFEGSAVFKELDRLTNGLASSFVKVGKSAREAFLALQIGSKLAKAALISTGVGAIIVALGAVAAYWQDILTLASGVETEQRKISKALDESIKKKEFDLKLSRLGENTLRLQGKSEKQILEIRVQKLKSLLKERELQIANTKLSLQQAKAQQKANLDLAKTVLNALNLPFKFLTDTIDLVFTKIIEIAGSLGGIGKAAVAPLILAREELRKAKGGVDKIINKFANVALPDLTSGLEEDLKKSQLEAAKLKSEIDGIAFKNLSNGGGEQRSENTKVKPLFSPEYLENIKAGIAAQNLVAVSAGKIGNSMKQATAIYSEEAIKLGNAGNQLFQDLNNSLTPFVQDTLSNLGNALGEALANGTSVVGALGSSFLKSLGGFVSKAGDLFIKYGLAAKAFAWLQEALTKGGVIAKTIGAVGLIAAGLALKAAGGAISASASGGISGGGGGGASASSGGGVSGGDSRSFSRVEQAEQVVVFKISGQNLIGVLRNASEQNARIAGANTLNVG